MTPITEREIGANEEKINNLEHRQRNDRMIMDGLADEIEEVRLEFNKFKHKAYGVSSASLVVLGLLAFIIDFLKEI